MRDQDEYQIRVQGWIGERWASWFDEMTISYERAEDDLPITTLSGPVVDQAALRCLLTKIWDLNLTLISVTRVETRAKQSGNDSQQVEEDGGIASESRPPSQVIEAKQ